MGGLQKLRSQLSGTCMVGSGKLLEKAKVAVEEETQVFDAVAKHGQALEPRAERKADVAFGIEAEVAHHRGMHLSRTRDLQPATFQFQVDFGRGLGEGKKR